MMIENYKVPSSIAEAAQLLHQGEATIVAGGTDLTPQTEAGAREFAATLINIQRIEEMRGISLANGRYRIGGLTTVTEILESETLAADVPVLVEAADHFASPQIRNASTLAGNLCNASPAGDMCIPLLLLDAEVELASWANDSVSIRMVELSDFFTGPGKTVLQAGELLTAIEFNQPGAGFTATFQKSGPRPALEISTVSMGVAGVMEGWRAVGCSRGHWCGCTHTIAGDGNRSRVGRPVTRRGCHRQGNEDLYKRKLHPLTMYAPRRGTARTSRVYT